MPPNGDASKRLEPHRLRHPLRFARPINALVVVPPIIASGAGAEMRQALGTAVFFGMIGVTLFGLLLTPVFYVSVRWIVAKVRGKRANGAEGRVAPVEHAVS